MKRKFGSGQKPQFPAKGKDKAGDDARGLLRKDQPTNKHAAKRDDDLKPMLGDIADEDLESALEEADATLAEDPANKDAHVRKFKVLRKMGDRPNMRAALQTAARECRDPFFGVKLAEALEEEGKYEKALEWRRWVTQFEPDDPDTIRRLAATAVRAGAFQTAEQSYSKLIDLKKGDESPLGGTFYEEMLGKGLDTESRIKLQHMGLRLLAKALSYQDRSGSLLEAAARLSYRVKDLDAAKGFYERAIETNPDHRNSREWKVELLRVYAGAGLQSQWQTLNEAFITELKDYLREYRGDSRGWTILAKQQIQAGYFEDAIDTLKSALVSDSRNAQALWELGRLYVRMGRSQEAIDYYNDIISDPNEKKSVRRAIERSLADLYFKTGRFRESLEIYQRDPEANLRMIAPIYEAVDELETAEELYLRSVKQAPRDARSHLGSAEYWVRREQWEEAAEASRQGLRCTYATEEVHSNLAVALATAQMRENQIEDALQTMEEICQAYPDSIHQQFRKVKLLIRLGRKDEAIKLAEEVRRSAQHQTGCAPAASALWSLLGECHTLLGNTSAGEQAFSNALNYDFMDSIAVRGLGIVAEKQGDLARALEMYQRFVVLDPLNLATPTIRNRIKELREKLGPTDLPEPDEPTLAGPSTAEPVLGGVPDEWQAPAVEAAPPPPTAGLPPTANAAPEPEEDQEGWLGTGEVDWFDPER
ncbi:MAG: tetratricopeptide repeat protein [Candidatus Eremiobacteraeota bacterium]|nr:tetratricopeptide repeat protein [Candidatus Eremiobacteraeota bacterium]